MNERFRNGFPNGTRRTILETVKRAGEATARQIAEQLRMTVAGVRQHLSRCRGEGVVVVKPKRSGPGRPALVYSLTAAGQALFGERYERIALDVLDNAAIVGGDALINRIFTERQKSMLAQYRRRLEPLDLDGRLAALAKIRQAEGFMAVVETNDQGGRLLAEYHCPVSAVASRYPKLCERECDLFAESLGPAVCVERVCHLLHGGDACRYRIEPRSTPNAGA